MYRLTWKQKGDVGDIWEVLGSIRLLFIEAFEDPRFRKGFM